ncbi:MAG TPA: queuosine precursor transporter [Thermomicrobiales bacterium]|nr:queuosine precursor transporter [Thermomicrobiales bacterium]
MTTSVRGGEGSVIERASPPELVSLWFVAVTALFVTALITANITAVKVVEIWRVQVPAGTLTLFPLSYIFGDVLTEVYGFRRARLVIWLGFFCNLIAVIAIYVGGLLPAAEFWQDQEAYDTILGFTWRLLAASFAGYLAGEFVNSAIISRLKLITKGRWLWSRTITSTVFGQFVDTGIFIAIAFWGVIPGGELWETFLHAWLIKVAYETLATPLTYLVVNYLKRVEQTDVYDYGTQLNPFGLRS